MRSSVAALWACTLSSVAAPAIIHAQVSEQRDATVVAPRSRAASKTDVNRPDAGEASKQIIALTNAFRRTEGLGRVEPDAGLTRAARYFADYMARTDKYGHGADGNTPAGRAKKFAYDYCIVSENIAYQYSSAGFGTAQLAQRFFEGWQNSPGHRKNMLDPNVIETAVAVAHSANSGHFYAVQLFGRPKSQSIEFSVANRAGVPVEYAVDDQTFPLPPLVTRTHQRCKPSELAFGGKTLQPVNGQRLVVVNDQGRVELKTQ